MKTSGFKGKHHTKESKTLISMHNNNALTGEEFDKRRVDALEIMRDAEIKDWVDKNYVRKPQSN